MMSRRFPRAIAPFAFVVSASACAQPVVGGVGADPPAKGSPVVIERDAGWPAPADADGHNPATSADGALCFGQPTFYPKLAGVIRAADMNGDGFPDIVSHSFASDVFVMFNTGDGTGAFLPASPSLQIGVDARQLDVGDLDGDGDIDIATTSQLGNALTLILNDGEGGLSLDRHMPFARPRSVLIGNIDRDPEEEIFVLDGAGVTLLDRAPIGDFLPVETFPLGNAALGDLDNDGDADLVLSISSFITVEPLTHLYLNDGDGGFTLWQTLPTFTFDATVVDLTGNGLPDIVHRTSANVIGFTRQIKLGLFLRPYVVQPSNPFDGFSSALGGMDVADLDLDGQPDIILNEHFLPPDRQSERERIRVMRGLFGGSIWGWGDLVILDHFQARTIDALDLSKLLELWGTSDPQADNSGDGVVDGRDMSGMLNNFGPLPEPDAVELVALPIPGGFNSFQIADFNNDGAPDVAVGASDGQGTSMIGIVLATHESNHRSSDSKIHSMKQKETRE